MDCPCQSSLKYYKCCGKYHFGDLFTPTVEALARARYSAYALNKPRFIYDTWDKSTRPSLAEITQLISDGNSIKFEIINTDMGLEKHDIGMITLASTKKGSKQNELGMYKRLKGKWKFYRSEIT